MRSKIFLISTLVLLAVGVAYAKSWRVSGAIVHMRQEEYEEAIKLLKEEVAEKPDNAEAWAYLGDAYANVRDFMGAAEAWARAEELYAAKNKTKNLQKIKKSRQFFWAEAFNAAQKKLARALSFNNENFVPEEGETIPGDLEQAEEKFVTTYHVFSEHPKTLFLLGLVYEQKAAYYGDLSEEEVVDVVDYDLATGVPAQRQMTAGEYAKEMWEKALTTFEAAVEGKHEDMAGENWDESTPVNEYLIKYVNAAVQYGELDKALGMIDPLLELQPDDIELLRVKAYIFVNMKDTGGALETYLRIAEISDDGKVKGDALGRIGNFYLDKDFEGRDPQKAVDILEEAKGYLPEDYRIYINLGKAYKEIGEDEKAREHLEKGNELYEQQKGGG
ncbi:MAG: tetratricopeptide repeat protein [Candidatus Coatesbacteria bacterium]|nr:MAG: tetratricopeptide repeat protein [Candidatus Coatesbacteria bacterium]